MELMDNLFIYKSRVIQVLPAAMKHVGQEIKSQLEPYTPQGVETQKEYEVKNIQSEDKPDGPVRRRRSKKIGIDGSLADHQ